MSEAGGRHRLLETSDRIELIATIVMAAAAILTAWAAFQSAKWSGIQAIEFSKATAARIESTRFDTRAGQLASVDVDVFLAWLEAVKGELDQGIEVFGPDGSYLTPEGALSTFFFDRMRDEFQPALEAWMRAGPLTDDDAPPTPFDTEDYVLADSVRADEKLDEAAGHTEAALRANQDSDNHVLTAVALALAIFFAGVSAKLASRRNRRIAITLASVMLLGAGTTLVLLPKVYPF